MTRKSSALILSVLAMLPLLATTAEAGRRDLATRKSTLAPLSPSVKQSLFDFSYWSRAVNTQITAARMAKVLPKAKIVTPSPSGGTPQVAPPAADQAVAAIAAAPGDPPRRIKDGNPVVILLNPKAVISSF